MTGSAGHSGTFLLTNPRFTILFDFGVLAILDGYYREAVTSFAAALERFHEFYIRVIWHAKGVGPEAATKAWKDLAKQSERQLGAFVSCHLLAEGKAPKLIDPTFRNDVVHRGALPSREATVKYAEAVFEHVWTHLFRLLHDHRESVRETKESDVARRAGGKKGGYFVYETLIDLNPTPESIQVTSVAQGLDVLRRYRKNVYKR